MRSSCLRGSKFKGTLTEQAVSTEGLENCTVIYVLHSILLIKDVYRFKVRLVYIYRLTYTECKRKELNDKGKQ